MRKSILNLLPFSTNKELMYNIKSLPFIATKQEDIEIFWECRSQISCGGLSVVWPAKLQSGFRFCPNHLLRRGIRQIFYTGKSQNS